MKAGGSMFRKSIRFSLVYFVTAVVYQLIFYKEVRWIDNIGIFILLVLFIQFYEWAKKPYKWKKERGK